MNVAQLKCLAVFAIFAVIGFGPVSPSCLIGMYVILRRPAWFLMLIERIYSHPKHANFVSTGQSRAARIKGFLSLLALFLADIVPLPIVPIIAFAIILSKPHWFYRFVRKVYGTTA